MGGAGQHFVWDFDPVLIKVQPHHVQYAMIVVAAVCLISVIVAVVRGKINLRNLDENYGYYYLGGLIVAAALVYLAFTRNPNFQIRYYGVLFAAAIYVGYLVMKWQFKRGGYGEEKADHLFLYTTLGIVIGARLGHVFFYEPGPFLANPIEILKIWKGGLASHGATIGIFITTWIFVKRHKVPVVEVLDRLAMSVAVGSSFIRLGNFLNSEIVGRISEAPYAIVFKRFDMNPRIPSQLVEVAIGLVVFLALFLVDRRYKEARPRGLLASLFLILYFALRFGVEFIKEEQVDFLARHHSPLTMGQYLSIPFFLGGCVGLYFTIRKWYVPAAPVPAAEPDRSYVRRKKKKR